MAPLSSGVCSSSLCSASLLAAARSLLEGNSSDLWRFVFLCCLILVGDGGVEVSTGLGSSSFMFWVIKAPFEKRQPSNREVEVVEEAEA